MDTPTSSTSHAIVVGGSLAGLLAARVLSGHFDRVTLLERDRYPDTPIPRAGVPQSPHVHALLARGLRILERSFPGIRAELEAHGAVPLCAGGDLAWLTPAGWGIACRSEVVVLAFSRPLLDAVVRRRVAALDNVTVLESSDVTALAAGDDARRVTGVLVRRRSATALDRPATTLPADLVVDASGRSSRAPEWLEKLGYERPHEIVLDAKIGYASRFYRPSSRTRDWKAAFVQAAPPERSRGGLLFPVEGDRWLVTLLGGGGDYPPTDETGFDDFLGTLASPILRDALDDAVPLTAPVGHRNTSNRLRRYDRMARRPEGFVVIGDAACAFNPVYGQGITVAAMEAEMLDACLAERRGVGRGFAREVQRRVARIVELPWSLATGEDSRYASVTAKLGLVARAKQNYSARVLRLTTIDPRVREVWIDVFNMLEPPTALTRPWILALVVLDALRRRKPARPQAAPRARPWPPQPTNARV